MNRNRGGGGQSWERTSPTYVAETVNANIEALEVCNADQRRDYLMNLDWADLEALVERGAVKRVEAVLIRKAKRGRR